MLNALKKKKNLYGVVMKDLTEEIRVDLVH